MSLRPATYPEFLELAQSGTVVPVVKTVSADVHTPVGVYLKLAAGEQNSFLYETARYSFVGARPFAVAEGKGGGTEVYREGDTRTQPQHLLDVVKRELRGELHPMNVVLPPFSGGAVGFLAHEAVRWLCGTPVRAADTTQDGMAMFFSTVVAFDHQRQTLSIIVHVRTEGRTERLEGDFKAAKAEIARIEALLTGATDEPKNDPKAQYPAKLVTIFAPNLFRKAAEDIKQATLAGDVYRVTLAQRLERHTTAHPFQIYRALRRLEPAPTMFYLSFGETAIFGTGSEAVATCRGKAIEYRVGIGSRPRGANETEDEVIAAELAADEDDIATHTLALDVVRSETGCVAAPGSVEIGALMKPEVQPSAIRMTSTVQAWLADGKDAVDALAAWFPASVLTGIPRLPALRLINAYEPSRRHHFGGCVFFRDFSGNLDACVASRVIEVVGRRVRIYASADIGPDTVPERLVAESAATARTLVAAVDAAEAIEN